MKPLIILERKPQIPESDQVDFNHYVKLIRIRHKYEKLGLKETSDITRISLDIARREKWKTFQERIGL